MTGDVSNGDFRTLRHNDRHTRSTRDTELSHRMRELIRAALKLSIGDDAIAVGFVVHVNGNTIHLIRPASTAPVSDIEIGWHMPAIVLVEVSVLVGHWRFGWRGQRAANMTLYGVILLGLAFIGTKFVLELILNK
jgi:hypothetical protein